MSESEIFSTLHIHLKANDFYTTGWWLSTPVQSRLLSASINGNSCLIIQTYRSGSKEIVCIYPYLDNTRIPSSQIIEINFTKPCNPRKINLWATNRTSPWHLLQTVRKDFAGKNRHEVNDWLIGGGIKDKKHAHQDAILISSLNEKIEGTKFSNFHACIWNRRKDLQSEFHLIESPEFFPWLQNHGSKEYGIHNLNEANQISLESSYATPINSREFGVNFMAMRVKCSE